MWFIESESQDIKWPLFKILTAASKIDPAIHGAYSMRHTNGDEEEGFVGNIDYTSPEQARAATDPTFSSNLDVYEICLLRQIPDMMPSVAELSMRVAHRWRLFRKELVRLRDVNKIRQPRVSSQRLIKPDSEDILFNPGVHEGKKPISYAIVVHVIQTVSEALAEIGRYIGKINESKLDTLYNSLLVLHVSLRRELYKSFYYKLQKLRQEPESYE